MITKWIDRVPSRTWPALGFVVVLITFILFSLHFREAGLMAPDESYFTYAARTVYEGQVPYRDFAYTQMPLLPYINGAVLSVIGFTLDHHRLLNSLWSLGALVVMIVAIRKRTSIWEPALLVGFLLAASPRWVCLQSMAIWCGLTGLLLNGALAATIWGPKVTNRRIWAFALTGTAAIGVRLTCAPIVAMLAVSLLLQAQDRRQRLKMMAIWLGVGFAVIAPFALLAGGNFLFFVWDYHLASQLTKEVYSRLTSAYAGSPAVFWLMATSLLTAPALVARRNWPVLALLGAAIAAVVLPMIPSSAWGSYLAASMPVAGVAAVVAIWSCDYDKTPLRHIAWLLPLLILFPHHALPLESLDPAAEETGQVARFINENAAPGPILVPANIVAVEANRHVIPGTELGHFSTMLPEKEDIARRVHMTTLPLLTNSLLATEPAAVVLIHGPHPWTDWNFRWALPEMIEQPEDDLKKFDEALRKNYDSVKKFTTMEIYLPKAPPSAPIPASPDSNGAGPPPSTVPVSPAAGIR